MLNQYYMRNIAKNLTHTNFQRKLFLRKLGQKFSFLQFLQCSQLQQFFLNMSITQTSLYNFVKYNQIR